MGFRTKLMSKHAASHLRPGEEIEQVAIARGDGADRGNYAVAATAANVYVLALTGLGFSKVDRVVTRIPIGKAAVERHGSLLTVGRRGAKPDHALTALPGMAPRRLEQYVKKHAA